MLNKLALQEKLSQLTERIAEQQWVQELKGKWDELDPQSKNILRIGFALGSVALLALLIISSFWSVHRVKSELAEKNHLLRLIQNSGDELKQMKSGIPTSAMTPEKELGSWASYFEGVLFPMGLEKENLSITNERPGQTTEHSKETQMDITLKHINVKQLVKMIHALESGSRAVRLRNLSIEEKLEGSGYLDATLNLSAFSYTGTVR